MDINKYKAILFDFDCTLYAPCNIGFRIVMGDLLHMFASHKERDVRKTMMGIDYKNAENFYKEFFSRLGEDKREWYFNKHLETMVRVLKPIKARQNAQAMIEHLEAKGIKVGILSDYPKIMERCTAIGLRMNADRLWSSEEFGCLKPAPRPFLEIAGKLGLSPKEMLYIGDRIDTDYAGAKAAGMDCILVKTKKNANEAEACVMEWDDIVKEVMKQ